MNAIALVVSFALFIGGLLLMGYSFAVNGFEAVMFFGGILACAAAFGLPIHLLGRVD